MQQLRKVFAIVLTLAMILTIVPITAMADDTVAKVGNNTYTTLAAAIANAQDNGKTVELQKAVSLSEMIVISATVPFDIDLNGFNITSTNARALWVQNGTVKITGENGGTISTHHTEGNSFRSDSSVIRVGKDGDKKAELTIDENITVSSDYCYGVTVFGTNTNGVELKVNGKVIVTGEQCAISGNGNSGNKGKVTINNGAVVSATTDAAIYHPQNDVLTINGGTITGPTAVYVKCGTVEINGGTLNATGAAASYSYNGNGCNATGDALVVDNCNYPGGVSSVTINGGTLNSANGESVGAYVGGTATDVAPVTATDPTGITLPANEEWVLNQQTNKYEVQKIADNFVAKIGSDKYESLTAAIDAAVIASKTSGNEVTVTLIKDAQGTGLAVFNATANKSANIVIDFGGCTYTVTDPVGSSNTVNQALHFEAGNTVKLYNGTIKMTTDSTKLEAFNMVMQNYCDLTIEKMTIDGTGIAVAIYPASYGEVWGNTTKPQFNYNNAGVSVITDSTITVLGDFGIDDTASVTIEDDAIITANKIVTKGTDARYASATPTIEVENGAKFKLTEGAADFAALLGNSQELGTADANGFYTVAKVKAVEAYDENDQLIGTYTSIDDAIEAGGNGCTVKLVADLYEQQQINSQMTPVTLDLNGHTIDVDGGAGLNFSMGYYWNGDHIFTVTDSVGGGGINITPKYTGNACISDNVGRTIIIEGGTFTSTGKAIYCTASNATMTINGGTFNGNIYVHDTGYGHGDLSITGGTINGTLSAVDNAVIAVSGGTFSEEVPEEYCAVGYTPAYDETSGTYGVASLAPILYYNTWSVPGVFYFDDEDPIPPRTTQATTPTYKREGASSYVAVTDGDGITVSWYVTTTAATTYNGEAAEIATVDENGLVTFTAPGSVKVWCVMTESNGNPAKSGSKTVTYKLAPAYIERSGEKIAYASLYSAFNAAQNGETVVLCQDAAVSNIGKMTLNAEKTITIDLNGYDVTLTQNYRADSFGALFTVKKGTLNITNSVPTSGGIAVSGTNARAFNIDATGNSNHETTALNIDIGVDVSSAADCCVTIFGEATLTTKGNLSSPNDFAIAGNGSSGMGGYTINVTGGEITSGSIAIYHPNTGALNISGGTIEGTTAVYVKAGTTNITDGKLKATGSAAGYSYNGNGANATGDALVVDNCNYPGSAPSVTISGGEFESANGESVGAYVGNTATDVAPVTATDPTGITLPADEKWVANGNGGYDLVKKDGVAQVGDEIYESLAEAIAAAQSGATVTLLKDIELTTTQTINKSLTIDLNNYDITATDCRALHIQSGEVAITGSGTISAVKTSGSSFDKDSSVIRVGSSGADKAKLTLGENVTVSTDHCYGVTVFGTNTAGVELEVYGTVAVTGLNGAISGNGNTGNKGAVTINEGAEVSSTVDAAIYHPQKDTLTINGGTITGPTAVYVKSGAVEIKGGTLTGTGDAAAYSYNGNGANATGDALVVDNCKYPGGKPSVTISGNPEFTSANGKGIGSYTGNGEDELAPVVANTNSITLPDDEKWIEDPDHAGSYIVVKKEYVAQIGEAKYESLAAAIAAVPANGGEATTITMLADSLTEGTIAINGGKNIILDLGGHTIHSSFMYVLNGKLEVKNGTITNCVYVYGSGTTQAAGYSTFKLDADATITPDTAWGIVLFSVGNPTEPAYGALIDIYGTINENIFVSGNIKEGDSVINVYDGATIAGSDIGIALNGMATVNVYGGTISGGKAAIGEDPAVNGSGIEVRSGKLNVTGGTIIGYGTYNFTPNGNGTTSTGVGIAVAQHTTEEDIKVNISGNADVKGTVALAIANPQLNDEGDLTVNVIGGKFTSTDSEAVAVVLAENETRVNGFISGGEYSSVVHNDYCAEDYIPVTTQDANGYYTVEVGETPVTPAIYTASLTLKDNIDVNFYVNNVSDAETAKYTIRYKFGAGGIETSTALTNAELLADGRFKIKLAEVRSYQMWETIYIWVDYTEGGNTTTTEYTYSVKQYFENMISKYSQLNNNNEYDKLITLCEAGLDYGANAQIFFNGKSYIENGSQVQYVTNSAELVNNGYNPSNTISAVRPDSTVYSSSLAGSVYGISRYSASLILGTETSLKIYLKGDNIPNQLTVTCVDSDVETRVVSNRCEERDGRVSYMITGIKSYELKRIYTITITDGNDTAILTYSPYTYACKNWENTSEFGLADLCKSLVAYGDAAAAYWNK